MAQGLGTWASFWGSRPFKFGADGSCRPCQRCRRLQLKDADTDEAIIDVRPPQEQLQVLLVQHAGVAPAPPGPGPQASDGVVLRHLVRTVASAGLVAFRVADKKPSSKKRPLQAMDDVASTDFTVRLYEIHEVHTESSEGPEPTPTSLSVSFHMASETPVIRLISQNNTAAAEKLSEKLIKHMYQWSVSKDVQYVFNINETQVSEDGLAMLRDVFHAGAVHASGRHYETVGFSPAEDALAASLVTQGWLVTTRTPAGREAVQLSARSVSERLLLAGSTRVFEPRVGISPAYHRIQLKHGIRPSQLELYMFLQRDGWSQKSWLQVGRSQPKLKDAFFERGSGF